MGFRFFFVSDDTDDNTTRDDDGGELYRVTNDNLLRVIADFVPYGKLQQQPLTMARTTSAKTPPQHQRHTSLCQ